MKSTLCTLLILAFSALAEDAPKPTPLTDIQSLQIQNLGLSQQVAKLMADVADRDKAIADLRQQLLQVQQNSIVSDICAKAKIPEADCRIDPATKTVANTRKQEDNKDSAGQVPAKPAPGQGGK